MTDAIDPPRTQRLSFLDGLRGLAALFVVFHHVVYCSIGTMDIRRAVVYPFRIMMHGQLGVDVFIVLSGFCLMLPVVPKGGQLRGGVGGFVRRRFRRIYPPYLAALVIFAALTALIPWLHNPTGTLQDLVYPRNWPLSLGSHLVLLHNLGPWIGYQLDPPMWSVATEWQIYFVFALLLLPIWRRWGMFTALAVSLLLGYGTHLAMIQYVAPTAGRDSDQAWAPWLLGLFGTGMLAAGIVFSREKVATTLRRRIPWGLVWGTGLIAMIAIICRPITRLDLLPRLDLLTGLTTAAFIIYCADMRNLQSPMVRLLEHGWAVNLGTWSYSLYLIHWPVLSLLRITLAKAGNQNPYRDLLAELFIGIPLALGCSYAFHLVFEKPFLPGRSNVDPSAVLAPAVK